MVEAWAAVSVTSSVAVAEVAEGSEGAWAVRSAALSQVAQRVAGAGPRAAGC